jgi:hypothetical protein
MFVRQIEDILGREDPESKVTRHDRHGVTRFDYGIGWKTPFVTLFDDVEVEGASSRVVSHLLLACSTPQLIVWQEKYKCPMVETRRELTESRFQLLTKEEFCSWHQRLERAGRKSMGYEALSRIQLLFFLTQNDLQSRLRAIKDDADQLMEMVRRIAS